MTVPVADHARVTYDAMASCYDLFTSHHDYDRWTTSLEGLARQAGLDGRRLLDAACGTGKSFLPFEARGYEVTACDISPAMIAEAARKAGDGVRLEVLDIRALPTFGEFDLVCCLDDALNYVLTSDELVRTLDGFRRNLARNGVIVFDVNSLWAYRSFYGSLTVVPSRDQVIVWDGHASKAFGAGDLAEVSIALYERAETDTWRRRDTSHHHRHHPRAVVERAISQAGLRCVAVRGMRLDGSMTEDFSEHENSKAVYVVRHRERSER